MAYNSNQQQNGVNEFTLYSNYRFNNAESNIDATCLSFRFWKTYLCVGIFPRKNTGNDEVSFDMNSGITVYLSHAKARILKNEIKNFIENPGMYDNVGIVSGQSVIVISNGSEYGKTNTPIMTIRKVGENGEVVASFAYEFKKDFYFSIHNYDGSHYDSDYESYQNLELESFMTILDEYSKAASGAIAFSVMDANKFNHNRLTNSLESIAQALGVEVRSSYNRQNNSDNRQYSNYSNNNRPSGSRYSPSSNNTNYTQATMDDLD